MNWTELTDLTGGASFAVERVRLHKSGITIQGSFELPLLAQLPVEDQLFIVAFVRSHGSIKEMERVFGVSYPTIKARLNRLAEGLGPAIAVQNVSPDTSTASEGRRALLDKLERGEINVQEALEELGR
jgi:hypothetical protein